jgi:hypothetical protein
VIEGVGLERPMPKLGCSAIEEEGEGEREIRKKKKEKKPEKKHNRHIFFFWCITYTIRIRGVTSVVGFFTDSVKEI